VKNNPHITTVITSCGGHCAFIENGDGYDGYFAERMIVDFLKEHI
jgi:predicted alpha/beta-fold hydrolase